jgi:hypothetical protein
MKKRIVFTKINFGILIGIEILFIVLCFLIKRPLIKQTPFSYDEPDYVANSILLDHFRHFQKKDVYWTSQLSYDQPHLYHYIVGLFLENYYQQPIHTILEKNTLTYPPEQNFIDFGKTGHGLLLNDTNLIPYYRAYTIILSARILSFYFYLLSGILIIFIFYLLNIMFLSPAIILFLFSPYVFSTSVLAQADGLLLLFISISINLSILYIKYPKYNLFITFFMGITCALALSTKLNGAIPLITSLLTIIISITSSKDLTKHLFHFLILILITISIFILLNPYLYNHPFGGIIHMFQYRFDVGKLHSLISPNQTFSQNIIIKFFQFSQQLYALIGLSKLQSFVIVIYSLLISVTIILTHLLQKKIIVSKPHLLIISNSLLTIITIFIFIPMNWARYYLPALTANIFIILLSCNFVFEIFSKKILSKTKLS